MKAKLILIGMVLALILASGCAEQASDKEDVFCTEAETGERLALSEARQVAMNSECVEEGSLTDKSFCNENTGTWWIDLDIEKQGCAPACVINVATKTAEINWRCTGVII